MQNVGEHHSEPLPCGEHLKGLTGQLRGCLAQNQVCRDREAVEEKTSALK